MWWITDPLLLIGETRMIDWTLMSDAFMCTYMLVIGEGREE